MTVFLGETRISLLKICMEGTQLDENFNYSEISERLEGYTGSDIANVCRSVSNFFLLHTSKPVFKRNSLNTE